MSPQTSGTSRYSSGHMLEAFLHDAFRGRGLGKREGECEKGKRKEEGVLCLRVAGVGWLCADVLSSGRLALLQLLFTSLWHWRCLIGLSGPVA